MSQQFPMQAPLDPQEIARETGLPVEQVQQDIARTGAVSKEELYPEVYASQVPEQMAAPTEGQMVSPGVVQDPTAVPPPQMPAETAPQGMEGIPPEVMQAVHAQMAPPRTPSKMYRGKRREAEPAPAAPTGPAWHQAMRKQ